MTSARPYREFGRRRRQVFEIPVVKQEVTEHHTLNLLCACGNCTSASFRSGLAKSRGYGPNIRALGPYT